MADCRTERTGPYGCRCVLENWHGGRHKCEHSNEFGPMQPPTKSGFAITKGETVYHWYVSHQPASSDPLEALLLGKTKCGYQVVSVFGHLVSPSPISAHISILEAILAGLYCGNCWRGTETGRRLEEMRQARARASEA